MWILILTLLVGNYTPVAIPGFTSNQPCQQAGMSWAKDTLAEFRSDEGIVTHYVCVRK